MSKADSEVKYPSRVARDIAIRRMARDGMDLFAIADRVCLSDERTRQIAHQARYSRYFPKPAVTQRGTP